jgi:hypothetical protein
LEQCPIRNPIIHYSNTASLRAIFLGGFNIKLKSADVISTAPKIANDNP